MRHFVTSVSISVLTTVIGLATNAAPLTPLPQGHGISANFLNDKNIAKDKSVLLAEQFDGKSVASLKKLWTSVSNRDGTVVKLMPGGASKSSKQFLQLTATVPQNTGGHLYTRSPKPVDKAFARFYVRFPKQKNNYIHHFVHFGGYNPSTPWPQGGAGTKPRGDDRITVGIEPYGKSGKFNAPGAWNFYAYWYEMKVSARNKYWGNGLHPVTPQIVPTDRWQCVEFMIKLNTPGKRNGELALWLDGKLVAHFLKGVPRTRWTGMGFTLLDAKSVRQNPQKRVERFEGFDFRTTSKLKINFFWLLHYVTDSAYRRNGVANAPKHNHVHFDNIVIATKYIGPIKSN